MFLHNTLSELKC